MWASLSHATDESKSISDTIFESDPPRMEHPPEKGKFLSGLVDVSVKFIRVQEHGTYALQHEALQHEVKFEFLRIGSSLPVGL